MADIEIVQATISDVNRLQRIGIQTFSEAFSEGNSEENMKKYIDENFSVAKITAELNDLNSQFYLALRANEVVGFLKINFGQSQTELQDSNALEIERIYVLKEFYGKNAGQALYQKAIEVARQKKVDYLWLGVWEHNLRAISFYKKNGFVAFDKHIFILGDDEQTDIMMKLELHK